MQLACQGYSVDVAKRYGVIVAVFLSIVSQCKTEENKPPFLSAEEISESSGLSAEEIALAINNLSEQNLLLIQDGRNSNKKYFYIDYDKIYGVSSSNNQFSEKMHSLSVKDKRKEDKNKAILYNLKNAIFEKDESVKNLYYNWIEAIMENPKSFLSKVAVQKTQDMLEAYSNGNSEVKKSVLDIAIRNCYRDISWAINSYERNRKKIVNNNFENYFDVKANTINTTNGAF